MKYFIIYNDFPATLFSLELYYVLKFYHVYHQRLTCFIVFVVIHFRGRDVHINYNFCSKWIIDEWADIATIVHYVVIYNSQWKLTSAAIVILVTAAVTIFNRNFWCSYQWRIQQVDTSLPTYHLKLNIVYTLFTIISYSKPLYVLF